MICGAHLLPPPTLFVVARHHAITIERYRTSVFLLKKGSQYLCNSIFHLLTDDRVWTRVREPAGAERKGAPNSQLPDQPFCRQSRREDCKRPNRAAQTVRRTGGCDPSSRFA